MSFSGLGDSSSSSGIDPSKLSDAEKRELQQFIQNESQKAQLQENIHTLSAMCFKKCVPVGSKISAGSLDRTEEPCVQNCVLRFMDANELTLKTLESLRQQ